jgi:hypothetical protein
MDSREIVGCMFQLLRSVTVKNGEVISPFDEAADMLDRYLAAARAEALNEAAIGSLVAGEYNPDGTGVLRFNLAVMPSKGVRIGDEYLLILADKQEPVFKDHDRYVYDDAKPADKQEEK